MNLYGRGAKLSAATVFREKRRSDRTWPFVRLWPRPPATTGLRPGAHSAPSRGSTIRDGSPRPSGSGCPDHAATATADGRGSGTRPARLGSKRSEEPTRTHLAACVIDSNERPDRSARRPRANSAGRRCNAPTLFVAMTASRPANAISRQSMTTVRLLRPHGALDSQRALRT